MAKLRHHFSALLSKIEPPAERLKVAQKAPAKVRDFLKEHDFETVDPHTRLIGSYYRCTAVLEIKDVDLLVFVPEAQRERTPNAVLQELKAVLDEYPDAAAETSSQRRSVRLDLLNEDLQLDIVPAIHSGDVEKCLSIPDRPAKEWIDSDPLGYSNRLSKLNQDHGGKVVRLVKLFKAWRDVQMKTRRPKSYVLEVMVFNAVSEGSIKLVERSTDENMADLLAHVWKKYKKLFEEGTEAPRIKDPQVEGVYITKGWSRSSFDSFMTQIDKSRGWSERALAKDDDEEAEASVLWAKVFPEIWPTDVEVKAAARSEASSVAPGVTVIGSAGLLLPRVSSGAASKPTSFHSGEDA